MVDELWVDTKFHPPASEEHPMLNAWAQSKAAEIGARNFRASSTWLHNFKKVNRIASRKATKYRYRVESDKATETQQKRNKFF